MLLEEFAGYPNLAVDAGRYTFLSVSFLTTHVLPKRPSIPEKEATKGGRLYFGLQFKEGYSLSWGRERDTGTGL